MSTVNVPSIPHSPDHRGSPPSRPAVRIYLVLSLFLSILLDHWRLRWIMRLYGPTAAEARLERTMQRQAVRIRETAERMGGLVVKVGQFLSSRLDLLPKVFIQELATLQDRVRQAPWDEVRVVLEAEVGPLDQAYLSFETTPMASASLGQVYGAVDWDGRPLAVKVQRPHIDRIVQADLRALGLVVLLATRLTSLSRTFDLPRLLEEFRRTVLEELDYEAEADNAASIRQETADLAQLRIPHVHRDRSTRRVLTMERLDGIKISDVAKLEALGISRQALAERVIHLYLHMVMDSGFFHADPHPGNLLVQPDGRCATSLSGCPNADRRWWWTACSRWVSCTPTRTADACARGPPTCWSGTTPKRSRTCGRRTSRRCSRTSSSWCGRSPFSFRRSLPFWGGPSACWWAWPPIWIPP